MKKNRSSAFIKTLVSFCLFILFLFTPISVQSATFNPINVQELVAAIQGVNASLDQTNTINLIATTYTLIGSLSPITKNVTINGATSNPGDTKISGNNLFRVFRIGSTGDATINNITIADGSAVVGGGILNFAGDLIINNCTIEDNAAVVGGGIANEIGGNVMINDTIIRNNEATAEDGPGGGGILNRGNNSSMTINRSQITGNNSGNDGGGVLNIDSPMGMTITDSVIADNQAFKGGGIWNENSLMTITNSIIGGVNTEDGNTAINTPGGIANGDNSFMTISRSTIANNVATANSGGGLFNFTDSIMQVLNSTISNNVAATGFGGGILNFEATLIMNNATVVENKAPINQGGGIWNAAGTFNSSNSIFAKNEAVVGPDCFGPMTTLGFNIIEQDEMCEIEGTDSNVASDMIGVDPLVRPFPGLPPLPPAPPGGPVAPVATNLTNDTPSETFITPTRALAEGSPAIDMGNPAEPGSGVIACETTDQRGVMRPADGDGDDIAVCDIGAFEVEEEPAPTPTPTPTPSPTPTPGGNGFAPGDANGDGNINILDVTVILNDILEISSAPGNGDCNEDGVVNILDVTCVLNIILED